MAGKYGKVAQYAGCVYVSAVDEIIRKSNHLRSTHVVEVEFPITQEEFAKVKKWELSQKLQLQKKESSTPFLDCSPVNSPRVVDRSIDRPTDRQMVWGRVSCYCSWPELDLDLEEEPHGE